MQGPNQIRRSSGAKAIAIDERAKYVRYRLYMLITLLTGSGFALGLHLILGR
ncbi:hypothetical protein KDA_01950 [Dictyobacter alpinus]|uniref:Uncharacterized protein n=1 Tax=Dictyobacter alpinus TaxID=2014873 RepID=A0A402B024_9CHLR|nr:hypothetical protein [Dictyobacter alpinus]GCE24711.1 hypothetical protein KDA_01950 [Dictyobacter alpinus]